MTASDTVFAGSVPRQYDRHLGPLLFEPYADEVARRAQALAPSRILETAAGTGIVTAALADALPDAEIVATDLNPDMLAVARERLGSGNVRLQPADAQDLPFEDGSFDLVVSQFGVMFYPDKATGNAEARRVLRDGGTYMAIIWDDLDRNPVSRAIHDALQDEFPENPPQFLRRAPFGYAERDRIEDDMRAGGFGDIRIEAVELSSRVSARGAAQGMCMGSPMTAELAERGEGAVERAAEAAERALQDFDGKDAPMSALFVTATR
ncbi:MAG TPA: class I SAM-dependent methyltransferase [Sphingomicrobium sp.]|nr:class I SAM-dependent methyltransferase [Sphingomicrobium sp.]